MLAAKGKGKAGKGPPPAASSGLGGPSKDGRDTKDSRQVADVHASEWEKRKEEVRALLGSTAFDTFIGAVIVMNSVTIGIEQTQAINDQSTLVVRVVESSWLTIYIVELGLRIFGHGVPAFRDRWVKLDVFLVILGVLYSWVFEPFGEAPDEMGVLMLLRTCRLMRLAKTARLLSRVQEFWMLIRGILNSLTMMSCIFVVFLVVLYIFTSLGIELITKHHLAERDPEFRMHVDTYFASIPLTMLTLIQFVTLDDAASVYKPLCEKDPWLALYFVTILLVVSILVVNLVAAVTISTTLDSNQRERDAKHFNQESDRGSIIATLEDIFHRLGEDMSGRLTLEEFLNVNKKDQQALCQAMDLRTPQEIFKLVDADRTEEVSIHDLFDCILDKVLATHGEFNLKRMERQVETIHWRQTKASTAQRKLCAAMERMTEHLQLLHHRGDRDEAAALFDKPPRKDCKERDIGANAQVANRLSSNGSGSGDSARSRQSIQNLAPWDGARKVSVGDARAPEPQCKDPDLASWEEEMAEKVRSLVDQGLQSAFERLRKVADTAKEEDDAHAGATMRCQGQKSWGDAAQPATKVAPKAAAAARKHPQQAQQAAAALAVATSSSGGCKFSPSSPAGSAAEVRGLLHDPPHSSKARPEASPPRSSSSNGSLGSASHQEQL